jgi:predicted nucleic acid-binding protein
LRLVVSDTGPVLHLHETHALQLLEQTGEVVVPPAVERELGRRISSWANGLPPWLVVTELTNAAQQEARGWTGGDLLDLGEAEALGLARQLGADWFLTDDTAARVIATRLGIEVHGSLGVVLGAAATEKVDKEEARRCLERLFRSSLWVSPRVRAEAMAALEALFDE